MKANLGLAVAIAALASMLAATTVPADAKGCIKGAIVGGVAGHYADHHGLVGRGGGLRDRPPYGQEARERDAERGARSAALTLSGLARLPSPGRASI